MVSTAGKTNSINVKDNQNSRENMILIGEKKKQYFYWKNFTFLTSLFRFMLFTLSGKYFEAICVTDSILAVWTRSLSTTKIVSEPHVSAKCEYGRIQILAELTNTKSINKHTCRNIFRSSQQKDLQRIILTLFLLTLNKSVLIKFQNDHISSIAY